MRASPRRSRDSGLTVVEMVVATSVLAVFVVLALGSVIPGLKITRQAEEELSSQREVVLAFDRLVKEMTLLDRATVTVATDTLSFLGEEPYTGTNSPINDTDLLNLNVNSLKTWTKNVLLRRANGHLWRREYPFVHGNALYRIADAQLPIIAGSPASEKIFAKNVELFEVTPAGRSRVYMKVRSVHRNAKKPVSCELELQVQMRGGN